MIPTRTVAIYFPLAVIGFILLFVAWNGLSHE